MNSPLTIWCDLKPSDAEKARLLEGTAGHRLLWTTAAASSVLASAGADPGLQEADIAVGQPPADAVLAAPKLKWLQITTAGYTRYDTDTFRAGVKAKGLLVCNSSAVYDDACAEHALAFLFSQARNFPQALGSAMGPGDAAWHGIRAGCRLLRGQKVLLVGYGAIATRMVPLLVAAGMEVTGVRRSPRGDEAVKVTGFDRLDGLLAEADHVVDILPQAPGTDRFFNAARFDRMKPGAVFSNIGRGTTVDQDALAAALTKGPLAAAWLDVTEPEPLPPDHPLRALPNCHLTPHTAGGHDGEAGHVIDHFLGNFQRYLKGEALTNRVF